MSLSGQLSDLSLAELIEFFCNQNKTGRLKIAYNLGPGYFYFQNGALADAKLGVLTGVDAVYYALTLENASFKFSTAFPPTNRTIQQPWAQVALEGLRRMDEGIVPTEAFPEGFIETDLEPDDADEETGIGPVKKRAASASSDSMSLSLMAEENAGAGRNKTFVIAGVAAVVVIMIAAIGVPAGWYSSKPKPADNITQTPANPSTPENNQATTQPTQTATATPTPQQTQPTKPDPAADAKRELERKAKEERERIAREAKKNQTPDPAATATKTKNVTVTVTVDADGHITSMSGGDPVAQRIARQRRYPPGKTTTVSIPVN